MNDRTDVNTVVTPLGGGLLTGKEYEEAFWDARNILCLDMITYVSKKPSAITLKSVHFTICMLYLKKLFYFQFGVSFLYKQ